MERAASWSRRGHHLGPRAYAITFGALLALTGATFGFSFLPLGHLEVPVALGIATLKAALVVLFFMHLWEQPKGYGAGLLLAVFLIVTIVALIALDVAYRDPGQEREVPFAEENAPVVHPIH